MIGLGTGTIATYGAKGDVYRFYDINPAVHRHRAAGFHVSQGQRRDDRAAVWATRGSQLEREPPQNFDVLAIDAFSSDAIPVHLITTRGAGRCTAAHEAGRRHRLPRHQPLPRPRAGRGGHSRTSRGSPRLHIADDASGIRWRARATGCCSPTNRRCWPIRGSPMPRRRSSPGRDWRLWTDDFNNLVQVLKEPERRPGSARRARICAMQRDRPRCPHRPRIPRPIARSSIRRERATSK